jgi:hypothetical protein
MHLFPTTLLDALVGFTYLTWTVSFSPEDIIIEGNSAGDNLALALVHYLVENACLITGLPTRATPPMALFFSHHGPTRMTRQYAAVPMSSHCGHFEIISPILR